MPASNDTLQVLGYATTALRSHRRGRCLSEDELKHVVVHVCRITHRHPSDPSAVRAILEGCRHACGDLPEIAPWE